MRHLIGLFPYSAFYRHNHKKNESEREQNLLQNGILNFAFRKVNHQQSHCIVRIYTGESRPFARNARNEHKLKVKILSLITFQFKALVVSLSDRGVFMSSILDIWQLKDLKSGTKMNKRVRVLTSPVVNVLVNVEVFKDMVFSNMAVINPPLNLIRVLSIWK